MAKPANAISLVILLALGACARADLPRGAALRTTREATTDQLIRMRCAHDGRDVVTAWTGDVYAFVADERPRRLFAVTGMNIARCLRVGERWHLTSRELMYYLDPSTGQILDRWANPWTSAVVPVVHVANRLVQNQLAGPVAVQLDGDLATIAFDIPLFYPNPLAGDAATRAYSPAAAYQAGEFFTFMTSAAALDDATSPTVRELTFTWHRLGPWLPWMDMGSRPGRLVYTTRGRKLAGLAELPAVLREGITTWLPLYAHAPRCVVDAPNETSWTYFARHLAAYLEGARFPLPAPLDPGECPGETPVP